MSAEPLSLYQVLALGAMAAFVVFLFRSNGRSRPGRSRPARRPAASGARAVGPPGARSSEVERLHAELLGLVYGDEALVKRLVDFERRTQPTREACYRAAIKRLLRDRLN